MIFTNEEVQVLSTIIVALETGGQVYGNGDWGAFGEAYSLSSLEHAITIGTGWYGPNALKLLKKIYNADPELFKKLDTAGVRYDFNEDWNTYKISKSSAKAKCIINIISTELGIKCQKEMLGEYMEDYASSAQALGVTDHKALAECCNFHYQGGYGAMKRVIQKTKKPYTLDNLYAAVLTDNVPNQIGTYTYRQKACYNMINKYWPTSNNKTTAAKTESKTDTSSDNKLSNEVKWIGYICKPATPRTWAGAENSILKAYKSLKVGTKIEVCGTVKDSKGSDWYYVKINGAVYGFVWHGNVSKTDPTKKTATKTKDVYGIVTADVLNVRIGPGTEYSCLKSIPVIYHNAKVKIVKDNIKSKSDNVWYYILINNNTYGYVHSAYIKKI